MTTYNFLARIAAEGDLAASAHEVLDLLYATGGGHDTGLRVREDWRAPGRWQAQLEYPYGGFGRWHDGDSPEACVASVRADFGDDAVDRLTELRRRHARDLDAVAQMFAVLRDAGNVCDVGAHVEACVARMVLRGQRWLVSLEWRTMLDVGRRERERAVVFAAIDRDRARVTSVVAPQYLTVASAHEYAALLANVARTLDAATAALAVEHNEET